MSRRLLLAGIAVLVASGAHAAERMSIAPSENLHARSSTFRSIGGDASSLQIGAPAPGFSWIGIDGEWHGFRQLFARGPVLLVFGAREAELRELDRARPALADAGVTPVAVLDMRSGSAARLARRLDVACDVIVDPQCVIAGLYGSLDPNTRRHAPSYFVLDERGTLRGGGRGALPTARRLVSISARSLGKPLPQSAQVLSQKK